VTSVLVVAHHERDEAGDLAIAAIEWLEAAGHHGWLAPEDAAALGLDRLASRRRVADADLVLALGGDGTMLRAVRLLDGAPVPLLGVNLGRLGYLTEVEAPELESALRRFVDGQWHVDERLMLEASVCAVDGSERAVVHALNEVVVEHRESGHTVSLQVAIDGEPFTSYAADGLIVSTPTGSTAYSLSARGPVVSPRHRALLLTPVAPHMLFDRSLVLDPTETIEITVVGHRSAALVVDGQPVDHLGDRDRVVCRPSTRVARFVRFGTLQYHQILKAKFGLLDR
jgi:NAD+ kinase